MIRVSKQTASEGDFSIGGQPLWSSSNTSSCSRGGKPSIGALANEITFKLGQRSHEMENELATWRRRVDLFR
jgi:hypothetical protein